MPTSVRIFISAVSDEFGAYRAQLRKDLTRHNVEVKVQEDFKDLGGDTLDKLDQYIAHCDAVVHLVGDMTGSSPGEPAQRALLVKYSDLATTLPPLADALTRGTMISYTQWEAWLALYHNKLLLIANPDTNASRGPKHDPSDPSRQAQASHLSCLKVMKRHSACDFTSPDNLAKHVALTAVLDLLAKARADDTAAAAPDQWDLAEQAADRRQRELWEAIARDKGVDPTVLAPLYKHLGESDLSPDQMRLRASEAVAAILDRASQVITPSNEGGDIDATIKAARLRLGTLDTAGARTLLADKIAEEETARKQRLIPLLAEKAEVERLTYDHEAAKATLKQLLDLDPDRLESWIALGDLWRLTGPLRSAMEAFRSASDVAARLAEQDPENKGRQRDLAVSYNKVGNVMVAQGENAGALTSYRAGLAIAERLAASDRDNADWQRDLSISYDRVGDVMVAQGDSAGALASYRAGLAIRERLAASDRDNADWQRDLSVSYNKVGDVMVAQGENAGALTSYRAGLAIAERLAASDRDNADWQRDLSISYDRVGDVMVAQGDSAGALASYRAGLAIRERLAASDRDNAVWQRDLIVSCVKIAEAFPEQAHVMLTRAQTIVHRLRDEGRLAEIDAWMPDELARRIAALGA